MPTGSYAEKTIAVRSVGVLAHMLADQLGTTLGMLDGTGALIGTAHYWPYGAQRAGTGVLAGTATGTDKRYTAQQQEATDTAFGDTTLGLYNYKARFYSTTLGRFVSADTVADGLNRYAYVHDNPLRYTDPSGLDAVIECGTGQHCEAAPSCFSNCNGLDDISSYEAYVIQYWAQHEHIFGDYGLHAAFAMLEYVLQSGWSPQQTLSAFHVAFLSTATDYSSVIGHYFTGVGGYVDKFYALRAHAPREIDTLIGYSLGGAVVAHILASSSAHGYRPESAILLQPALTFLGSGDLTSQTAPFTRIVTVNGEGSWVNGSIPGAVDVVTSDCGGLFHHCNDPQLAQFAMWAVQQPVGPSGTQYVLAAAALEGLDVSVAPYHPMPAPAPMSGY